MKILIFSLLAGVAAGLLGALCGVGGGIIMVPAFMTLGLAHKNAIATSLAVIVIIALISTINNARTAAMIDWKIVAITSVGAAAAAWFGTDLMQQLKTPTLTKIFGVVLIAVGIKMLWKP